MTIRMIMTIRLKMSMNKGISFRFHKIWIWFLLRLTPETGVSRSKKQYFRAKGKSHIAVTQRGKKFMKKCSYLRTITLYLWVVEKMWYIFERIVNKSIIFCEVRIWKNDRRNIEGLPRADIPLTGNVSPGLAFNLILLLSQHRSLLPDLHKAHVFLILRHFPEYPGAVQSWIFQRSDFLSMYPGHNIWSRS